MVTGRPVTEKVGPLAVIRNPLAGTGGPLDSTGDPLADITGKANYEACWMSQEALRGEHNSPEK